MQHHPTVILDGKCWFVVAENTHTLVVVREGQRRTVRVEDVR